MESLVSSRDCSAEEEVCIHGRSIHEVQQLAATFDLSRSVVATLLRLHGDRLEEKLLVDREGLLRAAGLGHLANGAASPSPPAPPADPPLPSSPEAPCPEPEPSEEGDAPFSLSLGHHPNTSILEARASSLRRLAEDCGTIRSILECSTGDTIPLPLVANGDAMRTTLQFYDALEPYDASAPSDGKSAWHSVTLSDGDVAWRSVEPSGDAALFDLIRVANYLETSILLKHALTALSPRLRGQTAAELRARFGLPNDLTEAEVRAAEAEPLCSGEPGEVLPPSVKRGTTGINVGESQLLVQALSTLETSTLRALKGVNAGMLSAVRHLLCRPDVQAARFTTIEIAEHGGTPEAVRLRRAADPLEPEDGWHQVGDTLVVRSDVKLNVQSISPEGMPLDKQEGLRSSVYGGIKVLVMEVGRKPPTGPSYTVEVLRTNGGVTSTDPRHVLRFPASELRRPFSSFSPRILSSGKVQTALHYAVRRGDSAMVAVLIEGQYGQRIKAAVLWEHAAVLVHDAHVHCLRAFLEALSSMGHDPDDGRKFAWLLKAIEGAGTLTRAAGAPHPSDAMLAFLLGPMRAPVERDTADVLTREPLHAAASLGYLGMVEMLLDHGANAELTELRASDLSQSTGGFGTPLLLAERAGHLEVAQLLKMRMAPEAANA